MSWEVQVSIEIGRLVEVEQCDFAAEVARENISLRLLAPRHYSWEEKNMD